MYKCKHINNYSHQWLSEFIQIYRENECLWREKYTNSRNKKSRDDAYALLLAKMQEVDSTANHNNVIGRLQRLRRNCKREFLKKQKNPQYRPMLWYYHEWEPTFSSLLNDPTASNEEVLFTNAPEISLNESKHPKTNQINPNENLTTEPVPIIVKPPNQNLTKHEYFSQPTNCCVQAPQISLNDSKPPKTNQIHPSVNLTTEPVSIIVKPPNQNQTKHVYFSQQSDCSVHSPGYDEDDAFALSMILELGEMRRMQCIKTKEIINETIAKGLLNEL